MKKPLLLLLCIVSISLIGTSQTIVTGGIYSNTTWTIAKSPYIIKDTVVIFNGVTLTIQPGVIVEFDSNTVMEERGNIIANGTPNDSITFTSSSKKPHLGIYQGIQVSSDTASFRYCLFSYAFIAMTYTSGYSTKIPIAHCSFVSNRVGIYSQISTDPIMDIDTCTFMYDTLGISWSLVNILGCTFISNGKGIECGSANNTQPAYGSSYYSLFKNNSYGIYGPPNKYAIGFCTFDSNKCGISALWVDTLRNCNILQNTIGLTSNGTSLISSNNIKDNYIGVQIYNINDHYSCNSICNNTLYNIVMQTTGNVSFKNNYWCSNDSATIQSTIYDAHQNINEGLALFTPFDTVACKSIFVSVNELVGTINEVKLFPNPSAGRFIINIPDSANNLFATIYNSLGENILSVKLKPGNSTINIENSAQGVYYCRVLDESGKLIDAHKILYLK